jgi:hypothetical protein
VIDYFFTIHAAMSRRGGSPGRARGRAAAAPRAAARRGRPRRGRRRAARGGAAPATGSSTLLESTRL